MKKLCHIIILLLLLNMIQPCAYADEREEACLGAFLNAQRSDFVGVAETHMNTVPVKHFKITPALDGYVFQNAEKNGVPADYLVLPDIHGNIDVLRELVTNPGWIEIVSHDDIVSSRSIVAIEKPLYESCRFKKDAGFPIMYKENLRSVTQWRKDFRNKKGIEIEKRLMAVMSDDDQAVILSGDVDVDQDDRIRSTVADLFSGMVNDPSFFITYQDELSRDIPRNFIVEKLHTLNHYEKILQKKNGTYQLTGPLSEKQQERLVWFHIELMRELFPHTVIKRRIDRVQIVERCDTNDEDEYLLEFTIKNETQYFRWKAGARMIIQVGDLVDGKHDFEVFEFLRGIKQLARLHGGDVIILIGNHEINWLKYNSVFDRPMGILGAKKLTPRQQEIYDKLIDDIIEGNIQASHTVGTDKAIFVHAGIWKKIEEYYQGNVEEMNLDFNLRLQEFGRGMREPIEKWISSPVLRSKLKIDFDVWTSALKTLGDLYLFVNHEITNYMFRGFRKKHFRSEKALRLFYDQLNEKCQGYSVSMEILEPREMLERLNVFLNTYSYVLWQQHEEKIILHREDVIRLQQLCVGKIAAGSEQWLHAQEIARYVLVQSVNADCRKDTSLFETIQNTSLAKRFGFSRDEWRDVKYALKAFYKYNKIFSEHNPLFGETYTTIFDAEIDSNAGTSASVPQIVGHYDRGANEEVDFDGDKKIVYVECAIRKAVPEKNQREIVLLRVNGHSSAEERDRPSDSHVSEAVISSA